MKSKQFLPFVFCILLSCNQVQTNSTSGNNQVASLPVIKTVMPVLKQALAQLFTVNASKGGKITTTEGTKITVPENCFVKTDGTPVSGNVSLSFTQYDSPMEIIISGIPMTIATTAGTVAFESAGMFQINGKAGNEDIKVAKDKRIKVELCTQYKDTNYNFYQFDEKKGEWVTVMKASELAASTVVNAQPQSPVDVKDLAKPVKIETFSPNTPVFELEVATKNLHGLSMFDNIMWTYAGEGTDPFTVKNFFTTKWQSTTINPSSKVADAYDITCVNNKQTVSSTVKPVLFGSQLQKAKKEYERLMAAYNKRLAIIKAQEQTDNVIMDTWRTLSLLQLGVYNCDRMWPADVTAKCEKNLKPRFEDKEDKEVICYYLINPTVNSATLYHSTNTFKYRTDCENYMMAVLPDNEIAISKPNKFNAFINDPASDKMDFTISPRKLNDGAQFSDFIKD